MIENQTKTMKVVKTKGQEVFEFLKRTNETRKLVELKNKLRH